MEGNADGYSQIFQYEKKKNGVQRQDIGAIGGRK
jgi:hypothetical protein